jgi:hypothetical protein
MHDPSSSRLYPSSVKEPASEPQLEPCCSARMSPASVVSSPVRIAIAAPSIAELPVIVELSTVRAPLLQSAPPSSAELPVNVDSATSSVAPGWRLMPAPL